MSVLVNADADYLQRTANLPTGAGTIGFFFMMTTDLNDFSPIIFMADNTGVDTIRYVQIGSTADGTSLVGEIHVNTTTSSGWSDTGVVLNITTSVWYWMALTWSSVTGAVTINCYIRPLSSDTMSSGNVSSTWTGTFVPAALWLGRDVQVGLYTGNTRGRYAGVKIWDRVLSAAEVRGESFQMEPVTRDSLRDYYPLWNINTINDYGPNAHNWTAGGGAATAEGPPVPSRKRVSTAPYSGSSPPPPSPPLVFLIGA